jgi:hypothetical protein
LYIWVWSWSLWGAGPRGSVEPWRNGENWGVNGEFYIIYSSKIIWQNYVRIILEIISLNHQSEHPRRSRISLILRQKPKITRCLILL